MDVWQYSSSGGISVSHWSWDRYEKGKFVEDESYEWSDEGEFGRRLGIRVRETKRFIFYREIRYKQRGNYNLVSRAGGWRIKLPFCKTYEQTRLANMIVVEFLFFFVLACLYIFFALT